MSEFDYKSLLGFHRKKTLKFSEFVDAFLKNPEGFLQTSATTISEAIKYFGFEIVVRSGEPVISYNIFKDLFSNGINAVFGQEFCIKHIMNVVDSADKEVGPNRGIVLVGPPASGKTNIVDLITRALEEYSQHETIKLYTFFFQFSNEQGRIVEIRSSFRHSPLLLFPLTLQKEDGTFSCPRRELFDRINQDRSEEDKILIPSHYQNASLDKRNLDILEALTQNAHNREKSLFDIIEECVRVEEIEISNAQAKGIANIDDFGALAIKIRPIELGEEDSAILNKHLPGKTFYQYQGAMVDSNRGILHIHDSFGNNGNAARDSDYKPLLMLLGSGKVAVESTQAPLDNTVILTTNIEEMDLLENQLTSSKLLDRIEKVPVGYLLDTNSEMDILKRDMANIRENYDFDPNLLRIASHYSVITRMLPPIKKKLPESWSEEKRSFYYLITPEQKLFIYGSQAEDPVGTIQKLPHWHPFRNEALRLGLNLYDSESYTPFIVKHPNSISLRRTELFTETQLKMIDDEFMRELWNEHYPHEGKHGISIRQLQNIMRNTIANSDGRKIHVGIFLSQLKRMIAEGPEMHHWLSIDPQYVDKKHYTPARTIGGLNLDEKEGDYGDFKGLVQVVKGLYYSMIRNEITICTVDRDPERIEMDLRRYLQHALLARAIHNKAFSHMMVPKFTFIDPASGTKVEEPDLNYMVSIEKILSSGSNYQLFRQEIAQKFLDLQSSGELVLEAGKSIISSKKDSLLTCFTKEHSQMLSHRKVDENINPDLLKNSFFHKRNDPEQYEHYTPEMRQFTEGILSNMAQRFSYSREIALDTIVLALRKEIISFEKILS
ncbi:MAG: hypothetical protein HQM13_20080 [SAR324 cluster bacterium]|nr:hypothetical protein [SAR324 cluster bacterium]